MNYQFFKYEYKKRTILLFTITITYIKIDNSYII